MYHGVHKPGMAKLQLAPWAHPAQSALGSGHFFHRGQHLSNECADLASQLDGLLSEVSVLVVAVALTSGCTAAFGTSMHPTPLSAPNGWGSAGRS